MDKNLVEKLVRVSGVQEGEVILIHYWGEEEHKEIADWFMEAVTELGGSPVFVQQSRALNQKLFSKAKIECFSENYFKLLEPIDAVLDIFAYQPVVLGSVLEKEQMDIYRKYMRNLFDQLMTKKRFTQIRIPTIENAQESGLDPKDYIQRMNQAYDIDYDQLKKVCNEKVIQLSKSKTIKISTKGEHLLELVVEGRPWIADCGDGDLPCGEVYAAPVENQTNGTVCFESIYLEDVGEFEDVVMCIEEGKLQSCTKPEIQTFIDSLTENDRVVCEIGFGYNEKVRSLCGYPVLDEKMCGTFHIAIGNNQMFGGENQSNIHLDFVGVGEAEINEQ